MVVLSAMLAPPSEAPSSPDAERAALLRDAQDVLFARNVIICITVYSAGVAYLGDKAAWNMVACGVALAGLVNMKLSELHESLGEKVRFPGFVKYAGLQADVEKFKADVRRYYLLPLRSAWRCSWCIIKGRLFRHP